MNNLVDRQQELRNRMAGISPPKKLNPYARPKEWVEGTGRFASSAWIRKPSLDPLGYGSFPIPRVKTPIPSIEDTIQDISEIYVRRSESSFPIPPVPAQRHTPIEGKVLRLLNENSFATASLIAEKVGCRLGIVYATAARTGYSFQERKRDRRKQFLDYVSKNPNFSDEMVANQFGLSVSRVHDFLHTAGIPTETQRKRIERNICIVNDLRKGYLWREVSKRHNVDEGTIAEVAKINRIRTTGRDHRCSTRRPPISKEAEALAVHLLRDTCLTYKEIVKRAGLYWKSSVTQIAKKHGLRGYPSPLQVKAEPKLTKQEAFRARKARQQREYYRRKKNGGETGLPVQQERETKRSPLEETGTEVRRESLLSNLFRSLKVWMRKKK